MPQRIESTVRFIGQQIASTRRKFTKSENRVMRNEEEIVEIERKRIARDLHDTVSQELFAANMILSGVATQALELEKSDPAATKWCVRYSRYSPK